MADATVLVVDDKSQIRRVLQATVSSSGYDVSEANNGPEAVEMVNRERPTLILPALNQIDSRVRPQILHDTFGHQDQGTHQAHRQQNPEKATSRIGPEVSDNYLRNQF